MEQGDRGPSAERDDGATVRTAAQLASGPGSRADRASQLAALPRARLGCRWVGIHSVSGDEVSVEAWDGPGPPAFPRFPASAGLTASAARGRQPVLSNDVARSTDYLENQVDTASELIVPVIAGGQVEGTIDAESEHRDHFDEHSARLLLRVADAIGALLRYG